MKKLRRVFWISFIWILSLTSLLSAQEISEPEISQVFRPIAEINDFESIQTLIDALLLAETAEETNRIEIIDVSNIGFGTNDVLIFYPSLSVYRIDNYPPDLTAQMREWSIEEQRTDGLNTLSSDYFYPFHADTLDRSEVEEPEITLVQNSLISDILESLNRNYSDMPISLRFERGEIGEGFTFQMWNYNENAFNFTSRPARSDSIAVNDFLYVLYSDSTVVADTTMYDILYINKTVEETIYMPPEGQFEQRIQTQNLPGGNSFPESKLNIYNQTRPKE